MTVSRAQQHTNNYKWSHVGLQPNLPKYRPRGAAGADTLTLPDCSRLQQQWHKIRSQFYKSSAPRSLALWGYTRAHGTVQLTQSATFSLRRRKKDNLLLHHGDIWVFADERRSTAVPSPRTLFANTLSQVVLAKELTMCKIIKVRDSASLFNL